MNKKNNIFQIITKIFLNIKAQKGSAFKITIDINYQKNI